MNIIYIQDQEIDFYNGHFYHSKSEHFFSRFLAGLSDNDSLIVYTGIRRHKYMETVKKYKDVTNSRITFKELPEFRNPRNLLSIKRMIKHLLENADFCYLRSGVAASFASSICLKKGIPYMAIVNEDIFRNTITHSRFLVRLSAFPLLYSTRRMIKNAKYACYVTQNYLQSKYPCNGKCIGCSDIESLDINEEALTKREVMIQHKIGPLLLGTVGAVSTELKGHDTVIRALAKLKSESSIEYRFQIVGSGNPERLQTIACDLGVADQIEFLGEFKHDEVQKWFEGIDIYIHPSRSEGLPRTILEAMIKATPCVCSSVGGIPELIDNDCLFDYDGNEVASLVEIIKDFTKAKMLIKAKRNFEHSKNYNPIILEKKRSDFFSFAINEARIKI